MLKNYLKIALRNIVKSKIYSFINIIGLAVSIAACILIFLWVHDEMSYDKFNKNADRIYRAYLYIKTDNHEKKLAVSPAVMGEEFYRTMPEIESFTRLWTFDRTPVIRTGEKVFHEKNFLFADSSFFNVFTAEFVAGNPKTALTQPNSVVLTEKIAEKYFRAQNPIGKTLNCDKYNNYTVTGVIKNFPEESHFHFDFLGSISSLSYSQNKSWANNDHYTYFLLRKGTNLSYLQSKINAEVNKVIEKEAKASTGFDYNKFKASGNLHQLVLQPLKDIHLYSHMEYEIEANSNISYIYILGAIALSILLIACINFVNLSTARSDKRAKEVGIRKTLGSYKYQISSQFFVESILTSTIAVAISIMLVEFLMPLFNKVADKHIEFNLINDIYKIPVIICIAVIIGAISGAYPALYLSKFQPARVLKNELRKGSRKSVLRSMLVIFQFSISIILIIGTVIVYRQLMFVQGMNLGFNKEQVLIINNARNIGSQVLSFKNELLTNNNIIGMTSSEAIPGSIIGQGSYKIKETGTTAFTGMSNISCDYQFPKVYSMEIKAGRFFSNAHPSDTSSVVINESAAKLLGIGNIENKYLTDDANLRCNQIIGIIKDFNFASLHEKIRPLVLFPYRQDNPGDYISIKIKPKEYASTLLFIENTWKKYSNNETPDYTFLDENIQKMYLTDQKTGKIATMFSALTIFIACLGLFGLSTYITEQRTKEIGIRKVLGATVPEIISRLSKEFTRWVLMANIIAWPAAYYLVNKWLQDFAYKTNLSIWVFILSGLAVLAIALLTVSANAIKAATANPIKSLKYE